MIGLGSAFGTVQVMPPTYIQRPGIPPQVVTCAVLPVSLLRKSSLSRVASVCKHCRAGIRKLKRRPPVLSFTNTTPCCAREI